MRESAAAILAFILFSKVLSPQFLIWLVPFVSVLEGLTGKLARWLFLLCCLLTTLIFPWNFLGLLQLRDKRLFFSIFATHRCCCSGLYSS